MWETHGQDDTSHLKSQVERLEGDSCEGLIVLLSQY
jgi:hypothetical protein